MNWKRWGIILILLGLIWLWQQWPDGKLHVVFCDVGQGDGSLVVLGAFQALVDTGPSEEKILKCLGKNMPFWDRQIDLVFISHPQSDHSGALKAIQKRYRVKQVAKKMSNKDTYRYNNLYFDILSGEEKLDQIGNSGGNNENEDSIVMFLSYGSFSTIFTGDIGETTELALLGEGVLKKTTVLKVPHHGSKFSSCLPFLSELSPKLAVVSVGAKNTYGHPNGDTLIRLDGVEAKVLRTDQVGTVEVVTDGETFTVNSER